jgi:hypothetical protein
VILLPALIYLVLPAVFSLLLGIFARNMLGPLAAARLRRRQPAGSGQRAAGSGQDER